MRVLNYQGIQNFRDLGGYPTKAGKSVVWKSFYRSAEWNQATESDQLQLESLGIRTVCDLRSADEATCGGIVDRIPGLQYIHLDTQKAFKDSLASWFELLGNSAGNIELADELMKKIYISTAILGAHLYAEIFQRLLSGELPLLIHCQAGKDRTGIGSALLLLVLGVDESIILEDYMLSAELFEVTEEELELLTQRFGIPKEIMMHMVTAKEAWLEAVFTEIKKQYASYETYFSEALKLSSEDVHKLREQYTC